MNERSRDVVLCALVGATAPTVVAKLLSWAESTGSSRRKDIALAFLAGGISAAAAVAILRKKAQPAPEAPAADFDKMGAIPTFASAKKSLGGASTEELQAGWLAYSPSNVDLIPGTSAPGKSKEDIDAQMRQRIQLKVVEEMNEERTSVTVRVPATSANMGSGFDTLGMALDMWSEITVERAEVFSIVCEGDGSEFVPADESNLICKGVEAAFAAAGRPVPPLKYASINRIPFARGLGSSSAAIVGGLIAGLVLSGHRLPCWGAETLLQLAANIEGHPDNVAPAIYGGIQLGIHTGSRWLSERVATPPGLQAVVFIPDMIGKTSDARAVLPDQVKRRDAVFNVGRAAFLVNALNTGQLDNLRHGVEDKLHQPQRGRAQYKHLFPCIDAAIAAGACCAYLSGAGPSVLALTSGASGDIFTQREKERVDKQVAEAMLAAAKAAGVEGEVYITNPIEAGAAVTAASPNYSQLNVRYRGDV